MQAMDMFVFGTSILWGQGHNNSDKIDIQIEKWLSTDLGFRVKRRRPAHSGAILRAAGGRGRGRLHGEAPDKYPSVQQQIIKAAAGNNRKKLILLDGGINDVGIFNIMNPLVSKAKLETLTKKYCYQHMKIILGEVGRKYPGAAIFVLGYYQIIADTANHGECQALLGRLGMREDGHGDLAGKLIGNAKHFKKRSEVHLRRAVREARSEMELDCTFVNPGIKPTEGVFGRNSALFGIGFDPQFDERLLVYCPQALLRNRSAPYCFFAAIGHPNKKGVRRYVKQLKASIAMRLDSGKGVRGAIRQRIAAVNLELLRKGPAVRVRRL